jgi:hypothetical protein
VNTRLLFYISLLPFYTLANDHCELTKEYTELRKETGMSLYKPFRDCRDAYKNSVHWKAVANCLADAKGQNVVECDELVTNREYPKVYSDTFYCDLLEPSEEFIEQKVEETAEEKSIKQCKT